MSDACFTVIAADDHPIVLTGIRLILRGSNRFQLVAETHDGESTLAAIEQNIPDFIILDLWMGDNDGIELLSRIHDRWPAIRILVYSMNDERSYGHRALRAGASGYLMKSYGLEELLAALEIIADGGRYLSSDVASELIESQSQSKSDSVKLSELSILSDREMQILRLIGSGWSTDLISSKLGISTKIVGAHRENLINKLSFPDSATLSQKAAQWVEMHVL